MDLILFALLVLFALMCVYAKTLQLETFAKDKPTTETTLSLYGDSISYAIQLNPSPGQALSQYWTVSNYAIAGMTLEDLMTGHVSPLQPNIIILPVEKQLARDKSKVLLVRLGINDSLRENDKSNFEADLVMLVTTARENGQIPVICGLTHIVDPVAEKRRTEYHNLIKSNCKDMRVHFIDISAVPYTASNLPDGLHLDQAYSTRVDTMIINYLQENVFVKIDK